ncbi:MAG: OB-fold nucleic acid binding domain-containing protein, partial [Nitrospirales bacterium]
MVRQGTEAGISDFYNSWLKFLSEQMAPLASRTIAIGPLPEGQQIAGTISRQIFKLLGAKTLPSHLEAELVSLRAVLVDFDDIENQQERQARLIQARDTLGRLQPAAGSFPIQSHSTTLRSSFSSRSERAITSKPTAKSDLWTLPIRFAKGVGPSRARLLEKLGVSTIEEAFWFLPWRYEDWSVIVPIQHLRPETKSTVAGCVTSCQLRRTSKKGLVMIIVSIEDGTGTLDAVFFNQPFLEQFFARGRHVLLRGEVSVGKRGSVVYQMRSPQYEVIQRDGGDSDGLSKLVPVYHET